MRGLALVLVAAFLLGSLPSRADNKFSVHGYNKNFFVVFNLPNIENSPLPQSLPPLGSVNNRLRTRVTYRPGNTVSGEMAYDLSLRVQDPALFDSSGAGVFSIFPGIDPLSYRVIDLDAILLPKDENNISSFAVFQNLDRAQVTLKTAPADVFIGRQALAWGSARVINPTDVLAPFTFNDLDTEERLGVDALRVRAPLGALAELDAGYVAGKDFDFKRSAFFARSKFYVLQTDVSLMLLGFRTHLLLGFDLARAIGGAGFWLESAYVVTHAFEHEQRNAGHDYARVSLGCDYSFTGKLYGWAEYHFNQAGRSHAEDYISNFSRPAYQDGAVYLLARHYLAPGATYQITPLVVGIAQALLNLNDGSINFAPVIEYNVAENIYLSAGGFLGIGKNPQVNLANLELPLTLRSEFGAYPATFYLSFRWYF